MRVKALFREYDYPINTVSGNQGSTTLSGIGTTFTDLKIGTILEVEEYGFVGKVASVQSDISLTLDRQISESFTDKVFWQDWTLYLVALSASSRKTESKQAGKTGVQVYDNISLGFYHVQYVQIEGQNIYNPVAAAFEGDLDSKKRYIIRLQAAKRGQKLIPLVSNTYAQIIDNIGKYLVASVRGDDTETFFEGMIDFETLKFPVLKDSEGEKIPSVTFDVIDKLSSLNLLDDSSLQRGPAFNVDTRLNNAWYEVRIFKYEVYPKPLFFIVTYNVVFVNGHATRGSQIEHTETILKPGETFIHPDIENKSDKKFFVLESVMGVFDGKNTTLIEIHGLDDISFDYDLSQYIPQLNIYSATYYGLNDICTYSNGKISGFDSAKMLRALIEKYWGDIGSELSGGAIVPLNHWGQLLDSKPFGKKPFDGLKYLVDSNNSYLLVDRLGIAQLHKRKDFSFIPSQNDKVIPEFCLGDIQKKHVWEKLVDCVEINVRSWIKDDSGKYIDGIGTAYFDQVIEPRNKLSKDVFIDLDILTELGMSIDEYGNLVDPLLPNAKQYELLNNYAKVIAEEYLLFYGRRHFCYEMKLQTITWDMLSWDLTSIFSYNNKRFFITDLEFDFVESTCSIKLVSIDGYSYNKSNILIAKNPETEAKNAASKSYNNYGGSAVILSPYWDGSSNGLDPVLGRKSLELSADNAPEFGSLRLISKALTGNYTLTAKENVILCDCTAADLALTLPDVSVNKNLEYIIQKTDSSAHKVIISGTVSGLTDHELLYQRETIRIKSDGTNWVFLSRPSVRTYAGSPIGQLVPLYQGEEVYNTTDKQWFKAIGFTNSDWIPATLRAGDDIILEPGVTGGTAGQVIVKQPGTQKSDNKYLAWWHDGVNAFLKVFTGAFIVWNKIVSRASADTDGTKQVEVYHNGTDGFVEPKTGRLKTNNKDFDTGSGESRSYNYYIYQAGVLQGRWLSTGSAMYYSSWSGGENWKPLFFQASQFGFQVGDVTIEQNLIVNTLTGLKIVETDANKKLISVDKGTAYNKNFGTESGTVAEGSHVTNNEVHHKYTESSTAPPATVGDVWYNPISGKVAISTIDGWMDLN